MLFNSSIGIEINDFAVNIVYLRGSFKGVKLVAESSCQLNIGKSGKDRQSDIVSFINGFIRDEKITVSDIFIGYSGDALMMREIEFPLAVRENLRTTVSYEIEKYIPLSGSEIYFDFHIISENKEEEKLQLLLVAVKKEVFEYYLEIAAQIEKGISGIGIVSAALTNYGLYHQKGLPESSILLFSREAGYDAVVLKNQSMVYSKSIAAAASSGNGTALIKEELIHLRDIFFTAEDPVTLVLYGDSASNYPVHELSDKFQSIATGNTHAGTGSEPFIPAFGIALNGIQSVPVAINLMPAHLRKKPNKAGVYIMFGLAGLLALAGVLWAGSLMVQQRQISHTLDGELDRLRAEAAEIEQLQSETLQMQKKVEYLQSLRPGNTFAIEIAAELSNIIPADTWLTNLDLSGKEIYLSGAAESASGLISVLEKSPYFTEVEFVSAIRKGRDGKEVFRIRCKIEDRK